MKKAILLILFLPLLSYGQWTQIGTDIDGQVTGENSGQSIKLNTDGTSLVIGSPLADTQAENGGKIRIFDRDGDTWVQRGGDIDGLSEGDVFGNQTVISDDGNVVAGGAPSFLNPNYLTENGSPGYVNVFAWTGDSWEQRGDMLFGDNPNDLAGEDVALNTDGSILAVSAFSNTQDDGVTEGQVRIYEWDGETYAQKGEDILGQAVEGFGTSVALNDAGTVVAIGAQGNSDVVNLAGIVRIFEWDDTNWVQKGTDIQGGEANADRFGLSVSLDGTGNTVSAGARGQTVTGFTKVFEWDGTSWIQKGDTLSGDVGSDFSGNSGELSNDGNTIVIGAFGNNNGYARVFRFIDDEWIQEGEDILGETENDQFGRSVSISGDGTIVAAGTPFNGENGNSAGHVRVFNNPTLSIEKNKQFTMVAYPNPTTNILFINASSPIAKVVIYNTLGQRVSSLENNALTARMDVRTIPSGHYVAQIETAASLQVIRFIKN